MSLFFWVDDSRVEYRPFSTMTLCFSEKPYSYPITRILLSALFQDAVTCWVWVFWFPEHGVLVRVKGTQDFLFCYPEPSPH